MAHDQEALASAGGGGLCPCFPTSHLASEQVAREILVRGSARPPTPVPAGTPLRLHLRPLTNSSTDAGIGGHLLDLFDA
jgi:hypothetical protein